MLGLNLSKGGQSQMNNELQKEFDKKKELIAKIAVICILDAIIQACTNVKKELSQPPIDADVHAV